MTDKLPPNLLKLFAPRPPLPYVPPLDKESGRRIGAIVTGIADLVPLLRTYDQDYVPWKSAEEKRRERINAKKEKAEENLALAISQYNVENDENIQGNAFNTLFVSRLSYELTEDDLTREFEIYGPIKQLRLVRDRNGKSRGYAFIEFEREKDMRGAYKSAGGLKMLGRRVIVDVERGRTVKGWRPRRLGGGLGGTRNPPPPPEPQVQQPQDRYAPSHGDRRDQRGGYRRFNDNRGGYGGGNRYGNRNGGSRGGYGRRDQDDRRRGRMRSRSRSPRGYRDSNRYSGGFNGGRGRDRSRDKMGRRDRDRYA